MTRQHGFSLMEVMVALVLVGFIISVSFDTTGGDQAIFRDMQGQTYARWVAANAVAEAQLSPDFPPEGKADEVPMGMLTLHVQQVVEDTPDKNLRKLTVTVSRKAGDAQTLAVQVAYIAKPKAAGGLVP